MIVIEDYAEISNKIQCSIWDCFWHDIRMLCQLSSLFWWRH